MIYDFDPKMQRKTVKKQAEKKSQKKKIIKDLRKNNKKIIVQHVQKYKEI